MAASTPLPRFFSPQTFPRKTRQEEEEDERAYRRHQLIADGLPKIELQVSPLRQLSGFWFLESYVPGVLAARDHFAARPTDVILASYPKCGTTWLKALLFSVVVRHGERHPRSPHHPLLATNPHDCVPHLRWLYTMHKNPDLSFLPPPRLLADHLPFSLLPESIKTSGCRLVYICRDPKDALVSLWHFWAGITGPHREVLTLDVMFDMFCADSVPLGPMHEHVLEYWREHRRRPEEVMFLKYEDVKRDPAATVRRLAAFVGRPFSEEEERDGVVEDVVRLCSLENLKRANMHGVVGEGKQPVIIEKKAFFRKGEIGDWANHLTPEMAEKIDMITQQKLQGSGLTL